MKPLILTIDTSHPKEVTVGLKDDHAVLATLTDYNQFGSQILLPMIVKSLEQKGLTLQDLTAVEVNPGPGSFTGIRVGTAVGQALAKLLNIPINGQQLPVQLQYS